MWRLCCVLSKKESRITGPQQQYNQQQQQQELQQSQLEKPESIQPPAIVTEFPSDPNSPSKTSLRSARRKSNGHTSSLPLNNLLDREETCRRKSTLNFEIDLETGRRPTLVAESTAQLALAESFVLDDLGESRRSSSTSVPTAIKPPISLMSGRRRITEEASISSCTKGDEEETETEALIPHEDKRAALDPSAIKTAEGAETGREEVMDSANSSSSPRKRTIMVRLRSRGSFRKRSQAKKEGKSISSPSRLGFMSPVWRSVKRTEVSAVPEQAPGQTEPCAHSHLLQTAVSSSSPNSKLSAHPAVCSGCSSSSRRDSLYIFSHTDEAIVTPFAQILASLRKVRSNFIYLTNVQSSKDSRFGTAHGDDARRVPCAAEDEPSSGLATETLEELEWCLERLESVQTHRSVSDMASSKFKKLLNKELNQILDGDKISSQISDYICSTFLDQDESEQAPPPPSDSSNNNNVSQPNEKSVQNTLTSEKVRRMVPTSLLVRVGSSSGGVRGAGSPSNANATEDSQKTVVVLGARPFCVTVPLQTSATASTTDSAMHSILGVSGSITGVGVDVAKMEQICAIPETSELPPPYGVVPEHPEELTELLENELDQWGMDIFKVADYTAYPLTCVTYTIMKQRGLINKFQIPHWNLVRCLQAVECHYSATTPYHNKIHAADVVQSVHVLLQAPALDSVFTDAELTAVIFACAVHDVNHPGVTNQYLVNTNDALAILYNDSSVLENYHLAVAFNLLTYPGCDILANFTRKQRLTFRRMVIDMVLSTDMSKHMSLLADLKTMVETKKVAGSGILNLDNYEDRMQILQNMVHCADLSNTAKPLDLYTRWMNRLMEEFFLQGDRERAAGLDISPMCDRQTATVEKSQVSFIDFISHPLWETWSDLVHPAAQGILELLEYNRNWYFNLIHAEDKTEENNQTITSKQT